MNEVCLLYVIASAAYGVNQYERGENERRKQKSKVKVSDFVLRE
jgi:hypothetical protein